MKQVIKLFNKTVVDNANNIPFAEVNKLAFKVGYMVHPSVCNKTVMDFLNTQKVDYNSTFYKSWSDITSKNRFELFIDQIKHYTSTYGTDFTGEVYLPEGNIEVPEFKTFKVILPISKEEVIERCEKMLFSGIALKSETVKDIIDILNELNHSINIELVKNKEAKMYLYKELNQLPKDAVEFVRHLIFQVNSNYPNVKNKTLLIKDKQTITNIKTSKLNIVDLINKFGIDKLSSVFFRFKPLFLAFKSNKDNISVINRLRKLADTYHVPMKKSYWEDLLVNPKSYVELPERLKTLNNFKKVGLLQTIKVRLKELDLNAYVIRNQKLYIKTENCEKQIQSLKESLNSWQVRNNTEKKTKILKEIIDLENKSKKVKTIDKNYLNLLYSIIYQNLVESLKSKKCKINIPSGINITLPVSEKSFVGNYPLGTSFDFSDSDNIVGIYWRGEDGINDYDLKLIDIEGTQYGWNAKFYNDNNSIIYSGDMTSANPDATELFYTKTDFKPSIVKVNMYSSGMDLNKFVGKLKFFIAKENIKTTKHGYGGEYIEKNYMVNPNNIIFNINVEIDSREMSLGVITGERFILSQFRTGKGNVAGDYVTNQYTDYALKTLDCFVDLKKLLKDSDFEFTDKNPDIDLNEISKDTLINLLS